MLGGALLGEAEVIDDRVETYVKHTGGAMSPFNAWVMLKGHGDAGAAGERAGRASALKFGRGGAKPRRGGAQSALSAFAEPSAI